ncbi:MAG: CDP-alcohol phosphatidyltransferase family protein [Phycisphaeraceae bacterium]
MYRQLPNQLTMLRLVLAGVFFLILNQYRYGGPGTAPQTLVLTLSFFIFIAAAVTDWLDGYLARRWQVESRFGRIMDPFCDKVLVIGAFIFLAGPRFVMPDREPHALLSLNMVSGVYPWMVVIILARELLVTGVRGELESAGVKFAANVFGKLKMILQSVAIPVVLFIIWLDPAVHTWTAWVRDGFVYATVLVTILSGIPYVLAAKQAVVDLPPPPPTPPTPPTTPGSE